ncbi:dna repair and recombination protein rad26 [Ophiostoma piceae UAMH 11346]|uniref:Dna repair and recombination protein rad26 n=1 Tax=Ophiostoma piceae (strain UAMH 11346) TaxID=1262450 RepID=S3C2A7_OPHP1|nr:dna repair and recombination protein rad26 [Ophiostoma piceae UAMH 11346]
MASPNMKQSPGAEDTAMMDEASVLKSLTENVRDQDDLERDITHQAELALIEAEDKRDEKRIEKLEATLLRLKQQRQTYQARLRATSTSNLPLRKRFDTEIAKLTAEIEVAEQDLLDFRSRIDQRHLDADTPADAGAVEVPASEGGPGTNVGNQRLPNETPREFLIRTGKITPFAKIGGTRPDGVEGNLADAIIDAEDEAVAEELANSSKNDPISHQNLRLPGFSEAAVADSSVAESEFSLRPRKKRKTRPARSDDGSDLGDDDDWKPATASSERGSKQVTSDEDMDDDLDDEVDFTERTRKPARKQRRRAAASPEDSETGGTINLGGVDDGNETVYRRRLDSWVERRSSARRQRRLEQGLPADDGDNRPEWFKPSPDEPDHVFENGLRLPGDIFPSLFAYQKTAVRWLSELYDMKVGGIIGDEMGLGKTVQLISFVAALHYNQRLDKPVIVVAPATVLRQWVNEFHRWWPAMRVSILHSSGSGMLSVKGEDEIEDEELSWDNRHQKRGSSAAAKKIVDRVVKHGHVLVTTYAGLQTYGDVLIPIDWGYAVLDEGHKIRNPNTAITVYCKELRTPNRIILSGTPMQNNLTELWSLFDFIYPMRLGTLINFRNQFEIPIRLGGYANASNLQIMTAQKCAETLKDAISPYLLQRLKADVATDLPKKSEQVLFCKLTEPQRQAYELFLKSDEMNAILRRARQSLYGIDILRKICNHPDLAEPKLKNNPDYNWGSSSKSGKMQVVKTLLQMWKKFGHKTLLFCQGTQMLDVLEAFVRRQGNINYIRMDGKTAIKDRQTLVDRFNNDPTLDLFLLTTKVGGLGTNLTGANRVIIFDPDWNPSTDVQARERAWRLGQKREVTIYRLMTAGTIEEKIYHRQIFKQFLTNKVLKDPKQRTTFGLHDLHDLFSLGSYEDGVTETSELFQGSQIKVPQTRKQVITPGPDSVPIITEPAVDAKGKAKEETRQGDDAKELRRMAGVAGLEEFHNANEEEDPSSAGQEDRIMKGIFAQSALHSAVEHDMIMSGGNGGKPKADPRVLEQEARMVAAEAARHLQRSSEQARSVPIGTVTWTGEVGSAGRPRNVRRGLGGPSSSGILSGLADRQGIRDSSAGPSSGPRRSNSSTPTPSDRAGISSSDFERMIPNFIKRHGNKVPSKVLVDHFNQYCKSKPESEAFKKALHKVAQMEKTGSSLRAIWTVKDKYK